MFIYVCLKLGLNFHGYPPAPGQACEWAWSSCRKRAPDKKWKWVSTAAFFDSQSARALPETDNNN